ncbi:uncharacterized protein PF11_0207 isoform X2 [Lingula anatina]|uniref:Uncharacterized protein PF11_0207 isoform X2 n=1 Tax=Lingula anatina TaxID=7574 RepID=A0A1S3HJ23_LINAN|nr:uncharacterized protein PF11_0207 isoform X2 [Lingula anatina]|eukprot:XP_013386113.1 uncharacterized protein PF11_0207 isoform X2 [Lingula anatina]
MWGLIARRRSQCADEGREVAKKCSFFIGDEMENNNNQPERKAKQDEESLYNPALTEEKEPNENKTDLEEEPVQSERRGSFTEAVSNFLRPPKDGQKKPPAAERKMSRKHSMLLRLEEFEDYKKHLKNDIGDLNDTIELLKNKIIELEEQLLQADDDMEVMKEEKTLVEDELEKARVQKEIIECQKTDLVEQMKDMQKDIKDLEEKCAMLQQRNMDLLAQINRTDEVSEDTRKNIEDVQIKLSKVTIENTDLCTRMEVLASEKEMLSEENQALKDDLAAMETDLTQIKLERKTKEEQYSSQDVFIKELLQYKERCEKAEQDNLVYQQQVRALAERNLRLEQELADSKNSNVNSSQSLSTTCCSQNLRQQTLNRLSEDIDQDFA